LGEQADRGERRAQLVAHLRHEVGLELAQIRFPPQEHDHEHDARDDDGDEAHGQDAEEQVVPRLAREHRDEAEQQHERRGTDDEIYEPLADAPVAVALSILRLPRGHTPRLPRNRRAREAQATIDTRTSPTRLTRLMRVDGREAVALDAGAGDPLAMEAVAR